MKICLLIYMAVTTVIMLCQHYRINCLEALVWSMVFKKEGEEKDDQN